MSARVLIGCELSGVVRRAFAARGFDAWSCDLEPSEDDSDRHIVGDILDVIDRDWDLIIAHPPCTRLCNSGVRWLSEPPKNAPREARAEERRDWPLMTRRDRLAIMWRLLDEGAELFSAVWNAKCPPVVVENPVMHGHAKKRIRNFEPATQTVQPHWFGDPFFKATGLYIRGLEPLERTHWLDVPNRRDEPERHKAWSAIHRAPPGPDRAKIRSRTFDGVANAFADQWGSLLPGYERLAA